MLTLFPGASSDSEGPASKFGWSPGPEFDRIPPSRLWSIKLLNDVVQHKDGYTFGHCRRVHDYSQSLGRALGLEEQQLESLLIAAAFHDIGKVGVLGKILNKRGPLDHYEWHIMFMHPMLGRELWEGTIPALPRIAAIIQQHHERWDGQGYPQGLAGRDVVVEARILHVADAYDAMMSDRPYRPALGEARALRELRQGAGTEFDPEAIQMFINLIEGTTLRAA